MTNGCRAGGRGAVDDEQFDLGAEWIPEEREEFIARLRAAHHALSVALLCAALEPNDVGVDLGCLVASDHLWDAHALVLRTCKRFLARHQPE